MIKENRIIFGNGDVFVNYTCYGLRFIYNSRPYEIGTSVKTSEISYNDENKTPLVDIRINDFEDLHALKKLLESVKVSDIKTFEYDNHIFDFTNFNVKSVDVVINHLELLSHYYLWLLPLSA